LFHDMKISPSPSWLDRAAREVLCEYPEPLHGSAMIPLGNAGGFSGARLWRVEGPAGNLCLRSSPAEGFSCDRLCWIHDLMKQSHDSGLKFVPVVLATAAGNTWVEKAGRAWELTTWMPGQADFHAQPTRARLQAAATALARLHNAWTSVAPATGPCPAVGRRLECVRQWNRLLDSGWRPRTTPVHDDAVWTLVERVWPLLRQRVSQVPGRLAAWVDRPLPLQPCLCDVWHDHFLFTGDDVTGLVDFGGVKVDHVTIDLARLLGSLVEDDSARRQIGLRAYAEVRALSADDEALVDMLDETGTVLGAANWLMWLYYHERTFDDLAAVARRLRRLVERIERWA
jgi:Ser/Thr protein kinase RdoA (MazF antagonist)